MAYLWTIIKYLTATLLLSYAYWVYIEDAWPYWTYTWNLPTRTTTKVPGSPRSPPFQTRGDYFAASDIDVACPPHQRPSRSRFGFGLGPGSTTVYGWPKKGGIYVLNGCVGIDLEFLGFDRLGEERDLTKETRSDSEEEEEAHCNKMRQLGATWRERRDTYPYTSVEFGERYDDVLLYIGWPTSGGVWALSMTRREAYDLEKPFGLIYNARDMNERCRMIERFGGTFYEDPRDCPYLDLANDTSSEHSGLTALKDEGAHNQI